MSALKLTEGVIASIAHDFYTLNKTKRQISQERDFSRETVSRALRKFSEVTIAAPSHVESEKEILTKKAYAAVQNGLDCPTDPYRQADVGIKTLKGIGEFDDADSKTVSVHIQTMVGGLPPEWRDRYLPNSMVEIAEKE